MSQFLPGTIRYGREDFPDLSPFTLRSARSYEDILSAVRVYLRDTVNPYIENDSAQAVWDTNATALTTAVDARIDEAIQALADASIPVTDAAIAAVLTAGTSTTEGFLDGRYQQIPTVEESDAAIVGVLSLATSGTQTHLDGRYQQLPTVFAHKLLRGTGIDLTGATDSLPAVQAFLDACVDGDTVVVPTGAIILIGGSIVLHKRVRFTGTGELRAAGGSNAAALILVATDGCHLDGLRLTNPSLVPAKGIRVEANAVRITNNHLSQFQDGIQVNSNGEWHDIIITGNQVLDIIGSGAGPGSSSTAGESNGDGIVCWGAAAVISGNRVTCMAGRDARIGIHCEALAPNEVTPYTHQDALVTISGNTISGQFRRGIASEGVAHVAITGNAITDATFWGIAVISAHYNTVTGNTIKWTRTAADTQGSSQAPTRSGIMLYSVGTPLNSPIIAANSIYAVAASSIAVGINFQCDPALSSNAMIGAKIIDNQIVDDSTGNSMAYGINIQAASTGTEIRGNRIPAFRTVGIRVVQGTDVSVALNRAKTVNASSSNYGVLLEGGAPDALVTGNRFEGGGAGTAISTQFRSGSLSVTNNQVKNFATGCDMYSSGSAVGVAALNVYNGVTTKTANYPAGIITTGQSN